jgi:G patch domain/KOW motif-containing protein
MSSTTGSSGSSAGGGGFSFGFSKVKPKSNLVKTDQKFAAEKDAKVENETDFVKEVNAREGIKGTKKKVEKKELVIECKGNTIQMKAMVEKNKTKKDAKGSGEEAKKEPKEGDTEDDVAEREIIKDLAKWKDEQENRSEEMDHKNYNLEVSVNGAEEHDATGVVAGEQSSIEDYDSIPVEGFGMGMLRGMGYKPGEGIGGFKKADVKCIEPVQRPKGLGLGATRANAGGEDKKTIKDEDGEELKLQKDAYVKLVGGAHKDMYGQVEGVDGETARVFVKLAVGGQTVSLSENIVQLVSKKEHKKYAKVINKDMYDKYREKQKNREVEWDKGREDGDDAASKSDDKKKRRKSRSRSKSPSESKKYKLSSNGNNSSSNNVRSRNFWVRPLLRVRFIDKRYKGGKYYNTKVVIEDVATETSCTVRTEGGAILDDVHPKQMETVIPRSTGDVVMILSGRRKGQVAELIDKDKKTCLASVQMLPDKDEVLKLDFDDVCEFAGEVMDY